MGADGRLKVSCSVEGGKDFLLHEDKDLVNVTDQSITHIKVCALQKRVLTDGMNAWTKVVNFSAQNEVSVGIAIPVAEESVALRMVMGSGEVI